MSPYKFAKHINEVLGINLPPQMFYTYAKKGYISSFKNEEGKIILEKGGEKGYEAFIVKYAKKNDLVIKN